MIYKNILVTVENPTFNINNTNAAVATVIKSFCALLQNNEYEVFVNGVHYNELVNKTNTNFIVNKQSKVVKLFPKRLREIVKDVILFKKLKQQHKFIAQGPKPDVILCWLSYGSSFSVDLALKWEVPLYAIFDNPIAEEYKFLKGYNPFFYKKITRNEKRILENSSKIIVYSHAVQSYLLQKYNLKNTSFYFNAFTDFLKMSTVKYERNYSIVNFAYIGSFFNWHKVDRLIEAFIKVRDTGNNCNLYLIGDGLDLKKAKTLAHSSPYSDSIFFTGYQSTSQLTHLLSKINVAIIPNALWFQAPVKLFQYAAASLPVITINTPTIQELSQGTQGLWYFNTEAELQACMVNAITNKADLPLLGNNNYNYIHDKFGEVQYINFFKKVFKPS